ncbi:MAG: hypothetical protein ACRDK1_11110 [Solirubrobacterales bacterium]
MRRLSSGLRLLRAAGLAALIALSFAAPVSAKMPYFTVEITPAAPHAGEPISVVVRTWEDAQHTIAAGFTAVEGMGGLLVIRSAGGGSDDIPVPLEMRAPDQFEGAVTLPAGEWTLITFPNRAGWATAEVPVGYPDAIAIAVRGAGPGLAQIVALGVGIAAAVLAIIVLLRRRSHRVSVPRRLAETHGRVD